MTDASGHILVVDGSVSQRKKLAALLGKAGFSVSEAADADAACAEIAARRPRAVLSGVVLPGLSGYDLCRKLKGAAETRLIPFLLITAVSDPASILDALACGADCFIPKPYDADGLVRRLRHMLSNPDAAAPDEDVETLDLYFLGEPVRVTAGKRRMLNLVTSAFEHVASTNRALERTQAELAIAKAKVDQYAAGLEGRVRVTEERLDYFLRTAPVVIYARATTGDRRATFVGERVRAQLGHAPSDFIDDPGFWARNVHPDDLDGAEASRALDADLTSDAHTHDYRFKHADGTYRWIRDEIVVVRDLDGNPIEVVGSWLDVTERVRLDQKYRALMEQAHDAVVVMDLEGRVLDANRRAEHLLQSASGRLEGKLFSAFVAPETLRDEQEGFAKLLAEGTLSRRSLVVREEDKTRVNVDVSASVVQFEGKATILAFVRDVEARVAMEQALRVSEERFRAFMDNLPAVAFIRDAEGRLVYQNRRMLQIPSSAKDEAFSGPTGRTDAATVERMREQNRSVLASGEPLEFEMDSTAEADGKIRSWLGVKFPIAGLGGPMLGAVVLEVTQQKHLQEQLRQSQKMEAVGQLAGGVAHDFNNLLAAILSYAELIYDDLGPDNPIREDVEEIRRAGLRAAALTRQLLAFSRRQVLQPSVVDLSAVVRDLENMLRRTLPEDVELVMDVESDRCRTLVDTGQMEQILLNLAVNASDAMPEGGVLTIQTRSVSKAHVEMTVTDTGGGMDDATRARIFEPFFTTKPVGKGTGLGLATVYGIVQQSQGEITVETAEGRGTTFTVRLPRVEAPISVAPKRRRSSDKPQDETVLLVEDDEALRAVCARMLVNAGYTVLNAADAPQALSIAAAHEGNISVLLTDVVMPHMSGPALALELLRKRPDMRTLFMSGYAEDRLEQRGIPGGSLLLEKPFSSEALRRMVREAIGTPRPPAS